MTEHVPYAILTETHQKWGGGVRRIYTNSSINLMMNPPPPPPNIAEYCVIPVNGRLSRFFFRSIKQYRTSCPKKNTKQQCSTGKKKPTFDRNDNVEKKRGREVPGEAIVGAAELCDRGGCGRFRRFVDFDTLPASGASLGQTLKFLLAEEARPLRAALVGEVRAFSGNFSTPGFPPPHLFQLRYRNFPLEDTFASLMCFFFESVLYGVCRFLESSAFLRYTNT